MNGLPGLRLLPDAPIPDGRTVLTHPEALNSCNDPVRGRGGISRPFIPGYELDRGAEVTRPKSPTPTKRELEQRRTCW
jgi:hypothetical protein